jgi:hypothetical protein
VSDTAAGHVKWTFSDDCLGAVRFPSGGTGAMIDGDPGVHWHDWDPTSDRVGNKVDHGLACFEDPIPRRAYIVVSHMTSPEESLIYGPLANGLGSVYVAAPVDFHFDPAALVETSTVSEVVRPLETLASPLADELVEVRRALDMPVSDLARMVGLGRRQFYNLLSGGQTAPATEARIRRVAEAIRELHDSLGGDADQVRAAVLTPVGDKSLSFFDAASTGDEALIREALEALRLRVAGRGIRRTRRAIPRAASPEQRKSRARRMREELNELSSPGPDPVSQGEPGGPG